MRLTRVERIFKHLKMKYFLYWQSIKDQDFETAHKIRISIKRYIKDNF